MYPMIPPQAGNLTQRSVRFFPPPLLGKLHWAKSLRPPGTEMGRSKSPTRRFLLLRPLYGSRDTHMRPCVELSHVLVSVGVIQFQSHVCLSTWDNRGQFEFLLLAPLGDLLFTGTTEFLENVIAI